MSEQLEKTHVEDLVLKVKRTLLRFYIFSTHTHTLLDLLAYRQASVKIMLRHYRVQLDVLALSVSNKESVGK